MLLFQWQLYTSDEKSGLQQDFLTGEQKSRPSSSYSGFTCTNSRVVDYLLLTSKHMRRGDGQTDLCSQVVSCGQMFEPEQAVPVASATSTWIMLYDLKQRKSFSAQSTSSKIRFELIAAHLNLPEGFAASGRGSRLPPSSAKKNILFFSVVVTCEELLLLCVEQPYNITLQR